jgi:Ig-like domain CHU_C associated
MHNSMVYLPQPTYSVQGTGVFIFKFSSTGNIMWLKSFAAFYCTAIEIDRFNSVYLKGTFGGTVDFDPGNTINALSSSLGNSNIYVNKLDNMGNFIWARNFGSSSTWTGGNDIDTDYLGNVYVAGSFANIGDFDPGPTAYTLSATNGDSFINKLNSSGNHIWVRNMGNSTNANSISVDKNYNIYCAGFFSGTSDLNPHPLINNHVSYGSSDIFLTRWDGVCNPPNAPANTTPQNNLAPCHGDLITLSVYGLGVISWYNSPTSTVQLGVGLSLPVSTLTTGNYTFYAQDYTCSESLNRTVITITVHALPSVSVSSNFSSTCSGNPIILNANGASNYQWDNGNTLPTITITPTTTKIYSVTGFNANNCSAMNTIAISVNPNPTLTIIGNTVICLGETAVLKGYGAENYVWNNLTSDSVFIIAPTSTATHSLNGTGLNGCSTKVVFTIFVNLCNSINEKQVLKSIRVSQNPSSGIYYIYVDIEDISLRVFLFNTLGQKVWLGRLNSGNNELDISHESNGVYYLYLEGNLIHERIKLIKK